MRFFQAQWSELSNETILKLIEFGRMMVKLDFSDCFQNAFGKKIVFGVYIFIEFSKKTHI